MKYTPQQSAAIQTRDVSIALAAGAGCGKTFVLTQRFVAELLDDPRPETLAGMMAITFTDRAAREMRDRIREAVRAVIVECDEASLPVWQEILRDLETARIQTIHSFCATTLRAFATELGLDPDFGVLDEPTALAIRNDVVQSELIRLLQQQDEATCEMVLRFGIEGVVARLHELLAQRFDLRETAALATDTTTLIEHWSAYHRDQFLPLRFAELASHWAAAELPQLLNGVKTTSKKMEPRIPILLTHLETLSQQQTLSPTELQELRNNATVQYVTPKHWPDPDLHDRVRDCCQALRKQIDGMLKLVQLDPTLLARSAHFGVMTLQMTQSVAAAYDRAKAERAVLDFDDLLLGVSELLDTHTEVRSQLQRSIRFLLLDEFQDTDPVQSRMVESLCGERLTTGGLFLVGDVKQSIYRFRRADPNVFRQLRGRIPQSGQLALTKNFRSQQEILDFVNFLFGPAMPDEYDALEAFGTERYPPEQKTEFLLSHSDQDEQLTVDEKRAVEANWIAGRITELLSDGVPRIRQKNADSGQMSLRPTEPGDIVILFRAMSNLALYENALRKAGVDYYVVGGRAFFAQQEIYDLVNLCRYLDDDTDEVALLGVLRSPLFGCSDDTVMLLANQNGGLSSAIISDQVPGGLKPEQTGAVQRARTVLQQLLTISGQIGIGPLLRFAVEQTAYDAALLTEFLGERKVANLHKLLGMADQFDQIGLLGLAEFADRLLESVNEEAKEELAATHPESGNVVRLMTVHQSKGLEFPVVFVADVNRKQNASSESAVLSPQLGPLLSLPKVAGVSDDNPALQMHRSQEQLEDEAEAIRLFYVATTRAADHLVISSYWTPDEKLTGAAMKLLDERFDLQTGLPAGDAILGQSHNAGVNWQQIPQIHVITSPPKIPVRDRTARKTQLAEWPERLAQAEPIAPRQSHTSLNPIDRRGNDFRSVNSRQLWSIWRNRSPHKPGNFTPQIVHKHQHRPRTPVCSPNSWEICCMR
jgi:ATP-dependent helicase/nuclease subunit A